MLANLRRKMGLSAGRSTPVLGGAAIASSADQLLGVSPSSYQNNGASPISAPFTTEELGFVWPTDWGTFSPSAIPMWIQEQASLRLFLLMVLGI